MLDSVVRFDPQAPSFAAAYPQWLGPQASTQEQVSLQMATLLGMGPTSYASSHNAAAMASGAMGWPGAPGASSFSGAPNGDAGGNAAAFPSMQNYNNYAAAHQALSQAALQGLAGGPLAFQFPAAVRGPAEIPTQQPESYPAQQLALAALLSQMQAGLAASGVMGASSAVGQAGSGPTLQEYMQMQMGAAAAAQAAQAAPNPWAMMLAASAANGQAGSTQQLATWPSSSQGQDQRAAVESAMVEQSRDCTGTSDDDVSEGSGGSALARRSAPWGGAPQQQHQRDAREAAREEAREEAANDENASSHHTHEAEAPGVGASSKLWEQPAPSPAAAPPSQPRVWDQPSPAGAAAWSKPWVQPGPGPETRTSMPPPPPRPATCDGSTGHSQPQHYVRALLGPQRWASVRATLLKQQQAFVQQLFELHKLSQLQKLLCAELLGYEPQAPPDTVSGGSGGAVAVGGSICGLGPVPPAQRPSGAAPVGWRLAAGASSVMSLPSVGTPMLLMEGDAPAAPEVPMGMQQRLQADLAQLVNIPGPLRSKAGNMPPDSHAAASGMEIHAASGPQQPSRSSLLPVQKEARQRPGVLRPQPTRLGHGQDASASQVSVSVGQPLTSAVAASQLAGSLPQQMASMPARTEQPTNAKAPTPAPSVPASAGPDRMMEAAAALLQSSGGMPSLPALSAPPTSGPSSRDLMMEAAAALLQSTGGLPPLPQLAAAAALLHSGGNGLPQLAPIGGSAKQLPQLSQLPQLAPLAPLSMGGSRPALSAASTLPLPAGSAKQLAGGGDSTGQEAAKGSQSMPPPPALMGVPPLLAPIHLMSLQQMMMDPSQRATAGSDQHVDPHAAWFSRHYGAQGGMAGAPPLSGPGGAAVAAQAAAGSAGRWWQDEAATFGDVAPSLHPSQSTDVTAQAHGSKRSGGSKMQAGSGSTKKGRFEDSGDAGIMPSAFKAFRPRKARSKRGSNRMGPGSHHGGNSSSPGDSDGSNGGGSCVAGNGGGSAAAARASVRRCTSSAKIKAASVAPTCGSPSGQAAGNGTMANGGGLGCSWQEPPSRAPGAPATASSGGEDKSAAGILLSLSTAGPTCDMAPAVSNGNGLTKHHRACTPPHFVDRRSTPGAAAGAMGQVGIASPLLVVAAGSPAALLAATASA